MEIHREYGGNKQGYAEAAENHLGLARVSDGPGAFEQEAGKPAAEKVPRSAAIKGIQTAMKPLLRVIPLAMR